MPSASPRRSTSFANRKPPHRVIIARGSDVRTFTVRPWLIGTLALITAVFGTAYLAATGYLVFRDKLLSTSAESQAHMQRSYEDRIAALRANIDRLTSRQALDQQQVEANVDRLLNRQAALDARQDVIAGLSQAARRAGIMPDGGTAAANAPAKADKAAAADQAVKASGIAPLADATLRKDTSGDGTAAASGPLAKISAVESSLNSLAREQVAYVEAVATRATQRSQKIATVLKRLGQKVPPNHAADPSDGVGGPLVELQPNVDPATFRSAVDLITGEVERFGALRRIALRLPLTKPVANEPITSTYGMRIDPFLGTPAMHTGIDFRSPLGHPARATADGTVTIAAYTGGYGNMVQIDHGDGITTRYGHLSKILVKVGQVVTKGTIIGRTGSTGRSTGPHLHYEVRVDGSAIDPMTFIRAGSEISPLL